MTASTSSPSVSHQYQHHQHHRQHQPQHDPPLLSPRSEAALQHLRRIKPLDGYSIESYTATANGKKLVRLKRRNILLPHDGHAGFLEIVVVKQMNGLRIVGIQDLTSNGDAGRGVVLVDRVGRVCKGDEVVTVDMTNVLNSASSTSEFSSSASTPATRSFDNTNNELLFQYGPMVIGAMVLLKLIFAAVNGLAILLLPLVYFYALQNCPSSDTFDAKRELKRVMRGAHLPEEQQPQGFFERGLNRLAASITAELATSLGYECEITDYFGAAKMAFVRVPVAGADFYWIGIFGKWRFIGQKETPGSKND